MTGPLVIRVCAGCGKRPHIFAVLDQIKAQHKRNVVIAEVECLDTCEREPSLRVGGQPCAPAGPESLVKLVYLLGRIRF